MSRFLRVARIDDRAGVLMRPDRYDPVAGDGVIVGPLELITFPVGDDVCLGIRGLESAEAFWAALTPDRLPDVVLGDVNFDKDGSSPLKAWGNDLPTGLSHTKPFAAIARAGGRPIAVALHNADPDWWEKLVARTDGTRVFGLLAAHEVIELAAIFGDPIRRKGNSDLAPVWSWLRTRSATTPGVALSLAITDFRRQVVCRLQNSANGGDPFALRILPAELNTLRGWCQQMVRTPTPLDESDPGLPLLYPDGRVDRISMASLFADVDNILRRTLPAEAFDLPAEAFDLTPSDDPIWELTNGLPRIGALVAAGGQLKQAIIAAGRALDRLPLGSLTLGENLRDVEKENVFARGLAVLFRILQIAHTDECVWSRVWNEGPWDPVQLSEPQRTDECPWRKSLETWVEWTEQALCIAARDEDDKHGFVDVPDITLALLRIVKDELSISLTSQLTDCVVRVHLDFLCQMQLAERHIDPAVGDDRYRVRQPAGHGLRPARPSSGTKLRWLSDTLNTELQDSLGFGQTRGPGTVDNPNAVGQIAYDAFLPTTGRLPNPSLRAPMGREFLEQFLAGGAPGWVIAVCRTYCRDVLKWEDERTWPVCVRGR